MSINISKTAFRCSVWIGVLLFLAGNASAFSYREFALTAGDPKAGAEFGRSIAIDGDCLVVGAAEGSDDAFVGPGAAYVFRWTGKAYVPEAKLDPKVDDPTIPDGAEFGRAVSIKGNVIVVGARFAATATAERAGAAYVYQKRQGIWSFTQKVVSSDSAPEDNFGRAIALDNDLLVITARKEDVSVVNDGAAYVFRHKAGIWYEEAKLTADDSTDGARFGQSVAVRGNLIVVGARDADTTAANMAGAAYVFSDFGHEWLQVAKLYAVDGQSGDQFAFTVTISGNMVLAGARRADLPSRKDAGAVYLFGYTGTSWQQTGKLTASDASAGDEFGHSIAMAGSLVAVGVLDPILLEKEMA
jgi:hypothetical protein